MNPHRRHIRLVPAIILAVSAVTLPLQAQLAVRTFGTGANTFTMDFVTIGNPGNLPDNTSYGAVATTYLMGKYEVSRDMITKATAEGSLGITLGDMSPYGANGVNRPATGVSWNEAARFVNWLNTSKGYSPAYKFSLQPGQGGYDAKANISLWVPGDAGYNASNPYRNANAVYFLPSEDEWYKAAYYSPGGTYFDYPTGSDTAPTAVAGGTTAGTAVYNFQARPAEIANAGGLSRYGTMGQGGNVRELTESASDGGNDSVTEDRTVRGGDWIRTGSTLLQSSSRSTFLPTSESLIGGFRVGAVPEPMESAGVIGLAALGFALWRRRGSV